MSNTQGTDYTLHLWKRSNLENGPLPGGHQREPILGVRGDVRSSVYFLSPNDNPESPLYVDPLEYLVELGPPSTQTPCSWPKNYGDPLHFEDELCEEGRSDCRKCLE